METSYTRTASGMRADAQQARVPGDDDEGWDATNNTTNYGGPRLISGTRQASSSTEHPKAIK